MIRLAQQFVYLGFYGDERTWPAVGYVPFSRRPEGAGVERKRRGGLAVESAHERPRRRSSSEVVVVGSGAAGAVIAYRLVEAGHDVARCSSAGPTSTRRTSPRTRSRCSTTPVSRRRRPARPRLQAPGAAGDVRRRDDGRQQRGLDPAAREGARATGSSRRGGRLDLDRVRAGVDSITELLRIASQEPPHGRSSRSGSASSSAAIERLQAARAGARYGVTGQGQHPRLPRVRLLQHRLRLRAQALDARHPAALGTGGLQGEPADRRRRGGRPDRGVAAGG